MTDQELNEAVARKLGWSHSLSGQKDGELNRNQWTPPGKSRLTVWRDLPDYCHSIAAAWEIVEKIKVLPLPDKVNSREISQWEFDLSYYGERWEVNFMQDANGEPWYFFENDEGIADTAPKAICKAFLKLP